MGNAPFAARAAELNRGCRGKPGLAATTFSAGSLLRKEEDNSLAKLSYVLLTQALFTVANEENLQLAAKRKELNEIHLFSLQLSKHVTEQQNRSQRGCGSCQQRSCDWNRKGGNPGGSRTDQGSDTQEKGQPVMKGG